MRICLEVSSQARNPYGLMGFQVNNYVIEEREGRVFACREVE
jgi:hypothetical protein